MELTDRGVSFMVCRSTAFATDLDKPSRRREARGVTGFPKSLILLDQVIGRSKQLTSKSREHDNAPCSAYEERM
jgi:hypothetical protein